MGIIQIMMPEMKLKGTVNMVLSLFLLIVITSPLLGLVNNSLELDFTPVDPGAIAQKADALAAEAARMTIRNQIDNITGQMGIKPKGVRIDIDVTGSTYNISAIAVILSEADEVRHDEIIARLREALGQAVYISYGKEDIT